MRPDDNDKKQSQIQVPTRPGGPVASSRDSSSMQSASANVARSQLDSIYDSDPNARMDVKEESAAPEQPQADTSQASSVPQESMNESAYDRTHDNRNLHANAADWDQYHSAWQNYYQQYFHRYYAGHLQQTQAELAAAKSQPAATPAPAQAMTPEPATTVAPEEALDDLRSKLRKQVTDNAHKARKSRHFVPIFAASMVMLMFMFLQYNTLLFGNVAAYVSPGNIDPTNIITNPNDNVAVSDQSRIFIPKINVDAPVIYDVKPDYDSQMAAMANGVAWFGIPGANSKPGQVGNTVLSGHSSNDFFDNGDYKFVFARLEQTEKGDTVYANYKGTRYTYTITKKEIVKPTDVQALIYPTSKPILTLITCTPLGTSRDRLLVTAEQVNPSPAEASSAPTKQKNTEPAKIPGKGPSFIQRVLGTNDGN